MRFKAIRVIIFLMVLETMLNAWKLHLANNSKKTILRILQAGI